MSWIYRVLFYAACCEVFLAIDRHNWLVVGIGAYIAVRCIEKEVE